MPLPLHALHWMKRVALSAILVSGTSGAVPAATSGKDQPVRLLLVGNSFIVGHGSPAGTYRPDLVKDLNGGGMGGVPAIIKRFTQQAGLNYQIAVESSFGQSLQWHWTHRRNKLSGSWDKVILQEQSTLNGSDPGKPENLIEYGGLLAQQFQRANPHVQISLMSGWSRPDKVYRPGGRWSNTPIYKMADDLQHSHESAARAIRGIHAVAPVGIAFNLLIDAGVADANPFDGIDEGKVTLWAKDAHHVSQYGAYTSALVLFGIATGLDPRTLGRNETVAAELKISPQLASAMQDAASRALCGAAPRAISRSPRGCHGR